MSRVIQINFNTNATKTTIKRKEYVKLFLKSKINDSQINKCSRKNN